MSGENENKTLLENVESTSEKVETVIKTTNATIGWMETIHKFIAKSGLKKLFMDLIAVGVAIIVGLWFFQPGIFVDRMERYKEEKHAERMDKRTANTPLIQAELDKFRSQFNISWAAVWELHNSTNNMEGMPFMFASLTYESRNPALTPIAEQFDNVRLSLYPISSYLRKNEIWCGDVEELKDVDNSAYHRAKALGIKYLGFKLMSVEGSPNAVLSAAFVEGSDIPNFDEIAQGCVFTSYKINSLLSLEDEVHQIKKKK